MTKDNKRFREYVEEVTALSDKLRISGSQTDEALGEVREFLGEPPAFVQIR